MVKNIVFDFGGVLLNLNPELTYKKLTEVMGVDITSDQIPAHIYKVMLGYEKGEINTETFLWNLQKESTKLTPQPDKLINAWNAMLLGWNEDRFQFLEKLRKDYKVFLLSNTNDLHIEWVIRDLKKNHKIKDFGKRFFDGVYYSHQMRRRKPELAIYNTVIEESELIPEECLFIDDNIENVEGAIAAGWNAVLHDPKKEIIDEMPNYLMQYK